MNVKSEDSVPYHARKMPVVLFAHGKESGPSGKKIVALAEVAKSLGYETKSPDFQGIDDPEERVKLLLETAATMAGPFILVGSSMGGYVVLRASQILPTVGIFLMAPAVGIPGYREQYPLPGCDVVTIIHAWQDEIIPANNVIEYAKRHHAELHMVNSNHPLNGQVPFLEMLFSRFIEIGNK